MDFASGSPTAAFRLPLLLSQPSLAPVQRAGSAQFPSANAVVPFSVANVGECGLGLVAIRDIPAGSVVYVDVAVEALQHAVSRALIRGCCFCLSPLGSPAEQLSELFSSLSPERREAVGASLSPATIEVLRNSASATRCSASRLALLSEAAKFLDLHLQSIQTAQQQNQELRTTASSSEFAGEALGRQVAVLQFMIREVKRLFHSASSGSSVECLYGCGEKYCSEICRSDDVSHSLLCVGPLDESHPIVAFKRFALNFHENMLLAAKTLCSAICAASSEVHGNSPSSHAAIASRAESLVEALLSHCGGAWEEMEDEEKEEENMEGKCQVEMSRTEILTRGAALLQAAIASHAEVYGQLATPHRLSRLLGLFERNNCDVTVDSFLNKFFSASLAQTHGYEEFRILLTEKEVLLRALFGEDKDEDSENDESEEEEEQDAERAEDALRMRLNKQPLEALLPPDPDQQAGSGETNRRGLPFPEVRGSAFFASVARINHSCSPNVRVHTTGPLCVIKTTRDVRTGEELTMGYCDFQEPTSWKERQTRLAEFGFRCRCQRCLSERPSSFHDTD